jgi:hypothetical protein
MCILMSDHAAGILFIAPGVQMPMIGLAITLALLTIQYFMRRASVQENT